MDVRPLSDVPVAEQVTFEPLTTSDWELIEMEASVLEDGGLLNQITIVCHGQVLPLRFSSPNGSYGGGVESAAWIKVVARNVFDASSGKNESNESSSDLMYTSDTDSMQSIHDDGMYKCLRLMAETEVSVMPKPRTIDANEHESSEENDSTKSDVPIYAQSCPLRIQTFPNTQAVHTASMPQPSFGCAYVHSSTLRQLPGYQEMFGSELSYLENELDLPSTAVRLSMLSPKNSIEERKCVIAKIAASDYVCEGRIMLNEYLLKQIDATILSAQLCAQIWSHSLVVDKIHCSRDIIEKGKIEIKIESISSNEIRFENTLSRKIRDEITQNTLISSGYVFPAAALRSLVYQDMNWLDQSCLYSINFQSTTDNKSESFVDRLGPIITGDDLRYFLEQKGPIIQLKSRTYKKNIPSPPLDPNVEGFSPTIERLTHDSCNIISISSSHDQGSTPHRKVLILHGDQGSGKTHLALTLASRLSQLNSIGMTYLDCKKLQATAGSSLLSILHEIQIFCKEAMHKQPSLLVLDDLDAIIPNNENLDGGDGSVHHHPTNLVLVSQVNTIVDHLLRYTRRCCSLNVALLCICRDRDSLAERYLNSGTIYSSVGVPSLDSYQRARLLYKCVFGKHPKEDSSELKSCISKLGKTTEGFRPHDLMRLARRVTDTGHLHHVDSYCQKMSPEMLISDVASEIESFTPLSQQSVETTQKCIVDWSSIGGLKLAKQSLYEGIIHPLSFKAVYENSPTSLPTGVMLFGFPGCGKSYVVPALAEKARLSLITCRGPELLDRYIGNTEKKIRQLFTQAITAAPSMIFFDEFDSLAPQRGSDHTGVTDRVVNQLLTLLDGAERNKKTSQIYIVAATSRPDKIDKALLRPGRLEMHVFFGYPESLVEWEELFSSILSAWDVDEEVRFLQKEGKLHSVLCKDLAFSEDLSAADMKAVLDTAHLIRVHEMLDENADEGSSESTLPVNVVLCKRNIVEAFNQARPSLLPTDRQKLYRYYKPFLSKEKKTPGCDELKRTLKTSFR